MKKLISLLLIITAGHVSATTVLDCSTNCYEVHFYNSTGYDNEDYDYSGSGYCKNLSTGQVYNSSSNGEQSLSHSSEVDVCVTPDTHVHVYNCFGENSDDCSYTGNTPSSGENVEVGCYSDDDGWYVHCNQDSWP